MTELAPIHGGQIRQIAGRFRVPASGLLDFSANVDPGGPPATVLSCLRVSIENPAVISNYPDLDELELRHSLAGYLGVTHDGIAVSNGFVPLLDSVLRVLRIQRCLVPVPAFVEYRKMLERSNVEMIPYILAAGSGFICNSKNLFDEPCDAILLANPQNPSGVLYPRDTMLRIVEEAADRKAVVLLDEAFIDYCPETSFARAIARFQNLIVFRSVTKFFGMAGLRIAYAAMNPDLCRQVQEVTAPWSITSLASVAASAAVKDEGYIRRTIELNNVRRTQMQAAIEGLGIHVYRSAANFLLLRLPGSIDVRRFWERLIRRHQILLRDCTNYESLEDGHLRAAVRIEGENERLVAALKQEIGNER
jgi:threonine-phosphate decarboxylase